jgi:putative transcriptional regulator
MLETADDMRRAGIMDEMTHAKITLRHLGDRTDLVAEPISSERTSAVCAKRRI